MKTSALGIAATALLFAVSAQALRAAVRVAPDLPQTSEIISVLRSNYVDHDELDDKVLDSATVAGVLQAVGCGAVILPAEEPATSNATEAVAAGPKSIEPLARVEVIDPGIGYIRLADVTGDAALALDAELKKFTQQKVTGFILDLRFADGTNYAAAAAIASRFLSGGQELFTLKSSEKGAQIFRASTEVRSETSGSLELNSIPLLLLVNAGTSGSAEALAAGLRAQDRGIVVGAKTAGAAARWKDVKLRDGHILRLATAKVVLPAKDTVAAAGADLFPGGITPDVMVNIDSKTEREVVLAAKTNETLTASLQPRVLKKGLSEAELVRAFRGQAIDTNDVTATKEGEETSEIQTVRDVVLQRAVDILKGIRVLLSRR